MQYIKISKIKPASYNPRKINQEQFIKLQQSIKDNGFVMPILVNSENMTIIAGHQRTKAATAIGIEEVPVYFCKGINKADEIKFNQIHNATDNEEGALAKLKEKYQIGFHEIDVDKFEIKSKNASIVKEICKLILKYGNVLCCVIDEQGSLVGANYVWACKLLKLKVNCSVIETKPSRNLLTEDYGVFSYDKLDKNTWVQGLAQMNRDATNEDTGKKKNRSSLYVNCILPKLSKDESILDFGCGKGAYISSLKRSDAIGVEFYNNNGSAINVTKGNKQIDRLCDHLKRKGKFDVVACDSVLNSVDSIEAEEAILGCLNLFCQEGGRLYISGRTVDSVENKITRKKDTNVKKRFIEFLDADNFTGNFRRGQWYYQHYHTKKTAIEIVERFGFKVEKLHWMKFGDSWQIEAIKIENISKEKYHQAVDFEFNLPIPDGTYNRHNDVKLALNIN